MIQRLTAALVISLLAPTCSPRDQRPDSVLLIVVDTLRADHLGSYGYTKPTSPHIDCFARHAVVMERAMASSPWTLPTVGSMLTGQLPSRHGAGRRLEGDAIAKLDSQLPTLPELMGLMGFSTAAIINNPFLSPEFGVSSGFRHYDHRYTTNWIHRRADETVDIALRWIRDNGGARYFLLVHFFDPHMTYDAPDPFRHRFTADLRGPLELPVEDLSGLRGRASRVSDKERAFVTAAYDEEIAFVDAEIGRLFETLEENGEWDDLIVVLTSDHGEELFDHGGFEHGHSMHQELLHVPLIIHAPSVPPRTIETPVSVSDLTPTILEAVGVDSRQGSFYGISLWPAIRKGEEVPPRVIVSEYTLSCTERKALIRWPLKLELDTETGKRRLFDLAADPEERVDIAPDRPDVVEALAALLEATQAEASEDAAPVEAPISTETLERLRSLGYVK